MNVKVEKYLAIKYFNDCVIFGISSNQIHIHGSLNSYFPMHVQDKISTPHEMETQKFGT